MDNEMGMICCMYSSSRQEEIEHRVNVLVERVGRSRSFRVEQNHTLAAALRKILILRLERKKKHINRKLKGIHTCYHYHHHYLLSGSKAIVLSKERIEVTTINLLAARGDDANTTTSNIAESHVEAAEVGAHHIEETVWERRELTRKEVGLETERDRSLTETQQHQPHGNMKTLPTTEAFLPCPSSRSWF
jgi:hypothetical protein